MKAINFTVDQLGYLEEAIVMAMDNEIDDEYYAAFAELWAIVRATNEEIGND